MTSPDDPTRTWDAPRPESALPEADGELGRVGGYALRRLLGEGGMGRVYAAEDLNLHRPVAIKLLRPELAVKPDARARFLREARAAAAVAHDHVVRIYQVGEDGGVPFLAMELLVGRPLNALLSEGPVEPREAARIGAETAAGLAAAHAVGLVHRDVKPANLWLEEPTGRVKLLDFGLARTGTDAALTRTGALFGTPAYMPPEQARGEPLDHRADLFGLGCVLYHLTTGRRPFDGPDVLAILNALATHTPPPPREVNPAVSPALSAVIVRLMAKDAADRPSSAAEVAAEFARIAAGEAHGATDTTVTLPRAAAVAVPTPSRKQRLLDLLLAAKSAHDHLKPTAFSLPYAGICTLCVLVGTAAGIAAGIGLVQALLSANAVTQEWAGKAVGLAVTGGMVVGCVAGGVGYLIWYRSVWRKRLARTGAELAAEFPTEVAAWGGPRAVDDPTVVESLLRQVTRPEFAVRAPAAPDPFARKERLTTLLLKLKEHLSPQGGTTGLKVFAILLGAVVGFGVLVAAALGIAYAVSKASGPKTGLGFGLTELVLLFVLGVAAVVGSVGGFLLVSRWFKRGWKRALDRLVNEVRTEFPLECAAWGGSVVLRDPATVDAILARVTQPGYAVAGH